MVNIPDYLCLKCSHCPYTSYRLFNANTPKSIQFKWVLESGWKISSSRTPICHLLSSLLVEVCAALLESAKSNFRSNPLHPCIGWNINIIPNIFVRKRKERLIALSNACTGGLRSGKFGGFFPLFATEERFPKSSSTHFLTGCSFSCGYWRAKGAAALCSLHLKQMLSNRSACFFNCACREISFKTLKINTELRRQF